MSDWPPERHGKLYIESICGQWRISATRKRIGKKEGTVYLLWKKGGGKWTPDERFFTTIEEAQEHSGAEFKEKE